MKRVKILSELMHSSYINFLWSQVFQVSRSCIYLVLWWIFEFILRFLIIKPISHLTMICYHQNPIRRTLGLTVYMIGLYVSCTFALYMICLYVSWLTLFPIENWFSLACLDYLGINFINFDWLIHDWFEGEILLLLDNQGLSL